MSGYQELTDEQWSRLKPYLPYGSTGKWGRNANNRLFIDALLWMARSGGRWRDMTSLVKTIGASSNSPLSKSGSND